MAYRIGEWGKVRNDFENVFHISIQPFYDGLATMVFKCIQINPFKFDDFLYERHKDYVEGISMNEILLNHYGENGLQVIDALCPPREEEVSK